MQKATTANPHNKQDCGKQEYSNIPLILIEATFPEHFVEGTIDTQPKSETAIVFCAIHEYINKGHTNSHTLIRLLVERMKSHPDHMKRLAETIGYGNVKYDRNSWRNGFEGTPERFLEACLRHCAAMMYGQKMDGEKLEGYPFGNNHKGAISFNLMMAANETLLKEGIDPVWR